MSKVKEYLWILVLRFAYVLAVVFGSGLSGFLYFFLNNITRYRSSVIDQNLLNSGVANMHTVSGLRKAYYRQLANYVVESIYGFYASAAKLRSKLHYTNIDFLENFLGAGKNVMVIASHYGNWEWAVPMLADVSKFPIVGVYKPISDKALDAVMYRRRSRFGLILASMGEVVKHIKTSKEPTAYVLIADQSPSKADPECMAEFFGIPTYFVSGPGKLSKRFDMVVLHQTLKPVDNGYEVSFTQLNPDELPAVYAQALESEIKSQPSFWLWSHKRWKLNVRQQRF